MQSFSRFSRLFSAFSRFSLVFLSKRCCQGPLGILGGFCDLLYDDIKYISIVFYRHPRCLLTKCTRQGGSLRSQFHSQPVFGCLEDAIM